MRCIWARRPALQSSATRQPTRLRQRQWCCAPGVGAMLAGFPTGLVDHLGEPAEGGARCGEELAQGLGRGPARLGADADALRWVEGGWIEPGLHGQPADRPSALLRQRIDGGPDLLVSIHGYPPLFAPTRARRKNDIIE